MQPQDPVSNLMHDHRCIESVMTTLERALLPGDADFPADLIARALAFFTGYADGFHHAKEELGLFPALVAHGLPADGGPIYVMLHEHELGRALLAAIRDQLPAASAGDPAARSALRENARQYIGLLRSHIWKEDNVLFPMARQVLSPDAAAGLAANFLAQESPDIDRLRNF